MSGNTIRFAAVVVQRVRGKNVAYSVITPDGLPVAYFRILDDAPGFGWREQRARAIGLLDHMKEKEGTNRSHEDPSDNGDAAGPGEDR